MNRRFQLLVAGLAILISGCGTTPVALTYAVPSGGKPTLISAGLSVGTFVDQRGEPANWLGSIRGGFGNPLKTLESSVPVSRLVEVAVADALRSRGQTIPAASPSLQVSGAVRKLFCNQVMQREAVVEIELTVHDLSSRAQVFSRSYSATNYESAGLAAGAFGSVDDLRILTERTLREVIDKALDDTALQLALRR
jgi:hypothetical protein